MRATRPSALVIVLSAWVMSGCALLDREIGTPLPMHGLGEVSDQSHYSDVLDRFGPPAKMSPLSGGMVFQYEYIALEERQYGLILPGEIGKWIKAVYASVNANVETLVFIFDREGMLSGATAKTWDADAGAGFSVTLIFSAGSLTDTARYVESSDGILRWGMALTESPLRVLNEASNLEMGANGVQLTATAPAVGQHTLELNE